MAHNDKEVHTTPPGRLIFVNLTTPRQFKNKGVFAYDTGLILSDAQMDEKLKTTGLSLGESIHAWANASVEKSKFPARELPIQPLFEKDAEGNRIPVAGYNVVKFKVDAETKTRRGEIWERKPKLFDRMGAPAVGVATVPPGTLARIKFTVWLTSGGDKAGVKLQPVSVQLIKLPEVSETFEAYEGPEGEDQGFGVAPEVTGETARGDF